MAPGGKHDGGSSVVGYLISVVAVGARIPQIVKIIRARSVEGIEPSLYEVSVPACQPHCEGEPITSVRTAVSRRHLCS